MKHLHLESNCSEIKDPQSGTEVFFHCAVSTFAVFEVKDVCVCLCLQLRAKHTLFVFIRFVNKDLEIRSLLKRRLLSQTTSIVLQRSDVCVPVCVWCVQVAANRTGRIFI